MIGGKWQSFRKTLSSRLQAPLRIRSGYEVTVLIGLVLALSVLTASLSLLVSTGPNIQHYLLSLIYSDAPSIYGSAYQDSLNRFPHLSDWLRASLYWPFILMSAIIAATAIFFPTARKLFLFSSLVSFFTLTTNDLLVAVITDRFSTGYVFENIIANAAGGILIGFTIIVIVSLANLCFVHASGPIIWRHLIAALTAILVGISLNTVVYYIADFFYRPLSVKLDVVFDHPFYGHVGPAPTDTDTKASKIETRGGSKTPFTLFPSEINDATIHWTGRTYEEGELVGWTSTSKDTFDISVEFFADCAPNSPDLSKSIKENEKKFTNIRTFGISLDVGLNRISTLGLPAISGRLATHFDTPLMFWLDRDENNKNLKTTQFVGKDAKLSIWNHTNDLAIFVSAPLATASKDGVIGTARTLTLSIDNTNYSTRSTPSAGARSSALNCRSLPLKGWPAKQGTAVPEKISQLSTLIRIVRRISPESIYGADDNELTVAGGNGWVAVTQPVEQMSESHTRGAADFLSFRGSVASLDVDDKSIAPRSIDHYIAFGEFIGQFERSGQLRFSGVAKALWKEQARINPTKWERLSWEQRIYILGIAVSILGAIASLFLTQIKNDTTFQWLIFPERVETLSK